MGSYPPMARIGTRYSVVSYLAFLLTRSTLKRWSQSEKDELDRLQNSPRTAFVVGHQGGDDAGIR